MDIGGLGGIVFLSKTECTVLCLFIFGIVYAKNDFLDCLILNDNKVFVVLISKRPEMRQKNKDNFLKVNLTNINFLPYCVRA